MTHYLPLIHLLYTAKTPSLLRKWTVARPQKKFPAENQPGIHKVRELKRIIHPKIGVSSLSRRPHQQLTMPVGRRLVERENLGSLAAQIHISV